MPRHCSYNPYLTNDPYVMAWPVSEFQDPHTFLCSPRIAKGIVSEGPIGWVKLTVIINQFTERMYSRIGFTLIVEWSIEAERNPQIWFLPCSSPMPKAIFLWNGSDSLTPCVEIHMCNLSFRVSTTYRGWIRFHLQELWWIGWDYFVL